MIKCVVCCVSGLRIPKNNWGKTKCECFTKIKHNLCTYYFKAWYNSV